MPATLRGQLHDHPTRRLFWPLRVALQNLSHCLFLSFLASLLPNSPQSPPPPGLPVAAILPQAHTALQCYGHPGLGAKTSEPLASLTGAQGDATHAVDTQLARADWLQQCPANECQAFYLCSEIGGQMEKKAEGGKQLHKEAQPALRQHARWA